MHRDPLVNGYVRGPAGEDQPGADGEFEAWMVFGQVTRCSESAHDSCHGVAVAYAEAGKAKAAACSTISNGWLAPSRNVKLVAATSSALAITIRLR